MTKRFAVVGNPIAHSRSPDIHLEFARQQGIELVYDKLLAPLDDFSTVVADFFASGGSGLNVTLPFKEQAFFLSSVVTPRATAAAAVNTLWMHNNQLHGDNTDGAGLVYALNSMRWRIQNARIAIIGAGGAARGVILPLIDAGATHITIANRTLAKAELVVNTFKQACPNTTIDACDLSLLSGNFDIVINATSATLTTNSIFLPKSFTYKHALDMAYGKPSDFLLQAANKGISTADGLGMLYGQAAESFFTWHGIRPLLPTNLT